MSVIKIDGLRQLPHMLVAAEAGADLLGMVFVPGVRRRVDVGAAREMAASFRQRCPDGPQLVGIFADQPVEVVNRVADIVGLDRVQLCGSEGEDHWSSIDRPILQVVHVADSPGPREQTRPRAAAIVAQRLLRLEAATCTAILDRHSDIQPGGLGEPFDWATARTLSDQGRRFILAGGLTPDNVAHAIATAHPDGVDVSSGVETAGVKDEAKIRAFVRAARQALGSLQAGLPNPRERE